MPKLPTFEDRNNCDTYLKFDQLRTCGQRLIKQVMIALNYKPKKLLKPYLRTLHITPYWPDRLQTEEIGMERFLEISAMLFAYINSLREYKAMIDERFPDKRQRCRHDEIALDMLEDMDHTDLSRCVGALEKWY